MLTGSWMGSAKIETMKKFSVGQKIEWLCIFSGKITAAIGEVTETMGTEWIRVKGHTKTGVQISDMLTTDDDSITA